MTAQARGILKPKSLVCIFLALCFAFLFACDGDSDDGGEKTYGGGNYKDFFEYSDGFSVNYLSVGNGDAIFINFGDGKTMLIDCAEKNDLNYKTITRYLDAYAKDGIDYLVLTHPDSDHTGNAADIIENYAVKTAYIPDLSSPENFVTYYKAYEKVMSKASAGETEVKYSSVCKGGFGEDYYFIMLSPNKKGTTDSAYDGINKTENPSETARNDLSPIIYLEYKGVRFVFTGDAGFTQEKIALANCDEIGIVDQFLKAKGKTPVNLYDIDFLKVSHHGADDASGEEFLRVLAPTNAVISVGGDNIYGHPHKATMGRLNAANENCNFYLTSVEGTVSVFVDDDGKVAVKTAKNAA